MVWCPDANEGRGFWVTCDRCSERPTDAQAEMMRKMLLQRRKLRQQRRTLPLSNEHMSVLLLQLPKPEAMQLL